MKKNRNMDSSCAVKSSLSGRISKFIIVATSSSCPKGAVSIAMDIKSIARIAEPSGEAFIVESISSRLGVAKCVSSRSPTVA